MTLFAVGSWQAYLHPSFIIMDFTPDAFTLTWERLLDHFNSRVTCIVVLIKTEQTIQTCFHDYCCVQMGSFMRAKTVLLYLHHKPASRDVGIFWVCTVDQSLHLEFLGPFAHSVVGDIGTVQGPEHRSVVPYSSLCWLVCDTGSPVITHIASPWGLIWGLLLPQGSLSPQPQPWHCCIHPPLPVLLFLNPLWPVASHSAPVGPVGTALSFHHSWQELIF